MMDPDQEAALYKEPLPGIDGEKIVSCGDAEVAFQRDLILMAKIRELFKFHLTPNTEQISILRHLQEILRMEKPFEETQ